MISMTRSHLTRVSVPPTIDDLMVRFLAHHSDAAAAAVDRVESEVEPHDVTAGFRVDARAAWLDAVAACTWGGNAPTPAIQPPNDWAALVAQPTAAYALPLAAGHFPQQVKDLQPLLANFRPNELRSRRRATPLPGFHELRTWIAHHGPTWPQLAAGLARLLGDDTTADHWLATAPHADNDRAANLWMKGEWEAAAAVWDTLAETPAVLFNRGVARVFLGRFSEAREWLQKAIAAIPDTSGWNALARLYLAVAEIHS
jgi:tetratricopeptide (TPR) repeat protein